MDLILLFFTAAALCFLLAKICLTGAGTACFEKSLPSDPEVLVLRTAGMSFTVSGIIASLTNFQWGPSVIPLGFTLALAGTFIFPPRWTKESDSLYGFLQAMGLFLAFTGAASVFVYYAAN